MGHSRITLAAVVAALAAAVPGLAQASQAPPRGQLLTRASKAQPYAAADTTFGLDVLGAWCKQDPRTNLVLSPASLATGLDMAYLGARGQTAAALARTLHLPPAATTAGVSAGGPAAGRALATFVAGLRGRLAAVRAVNLPGTALLDSDRVWADPRVRIERSYLDHVATAFRSPVERVPLLSDAEAARAAINAAVGQQTRGQITDLLPAGSVQGLGWMLTDAIYLNARWARPFDHARTAVGSFTTAAGRTVRPEFLHGVGDYNYADAGGWTAVSLPYLGGRLAMIALRPDSNPAGCPDIGPAALNRVISLLAASPVGLALPRVRLSSRADMAGLLSSLGMGVAFGPDADFGGMAPNAAALGVVEHAATLRVDENGTVAAAATGVGVGVAIALPHRDVVFDRPYLLLVRDTVTGEPLFLARVADPSQG